MYISNNKHFIYLFEIVVFVVYNQYRVFTAFWQSCKTSQTCIV